MRKAMLFLTVFGLVGSLWAADPMVGTWKLNLAKSKFAPGQQANVKEMTVVVREIGSDLETAFSGNGADGSPISYKFTMPKQGGVLGSGQAPAEGTFVVITVIKPGDMYGTSLENGKQVQVTHTFVSEDGKTMNRMLKSMDDKGQSIEVMEVWDKQ
jgi:hypothetical protein